MKKVAKGAEPEELLDFRTRHPTCSWDRFKTMAPSAYEKVADQLRQDQGGLCCYCEIDLCQRTSTSDADFRIEHFHPKKDGPPWPFAWSNLLGCCHGGSQRSVPLRFSPDKTDRSCDVPKGGDNLDAVILNPLSMPMTRLFDFNRSTGELKPSTMCCAQDENMAEETLIRLNLNCQRLRNLRKAVVDKINQQIRERMEKGESVEQASAYIAKAQFTSGPTWPIFFTSVRAYLGKAAEQRLIELNYAG